MRVNGVFHFVVHLEETVGAQTERRTEVSAFDISKSCNVAGDFTKNNVVFTAVYVDEKPYFVKVFRQRIVKFRQIMGKLAVADDNCQQLSVNVPCNNMSHLAAKRFFVVGGNFVLVKVVAKQFHQFLTPQTAQQTVVHVNYFVGAAFVHTYLYVADSSRHRQTKFVAIGKHMRRRYATSHRHSVQFADFGKVSLHLALLKGQLLGVLHVHERTTAANAVVGATRFFALRRAFDNRHYVAVCNLALYMVYFYFCPFADAQKRHKHRCAAGNAYRFGIAVVLGDKIYNIVYFHNFSTLVSQNRYVKIFVFRRLPHTHLQNMGCDVITNNICEAVLPHCRKKFSSRTAMQFCYLRLL